MEYTNQHKLRAAILVTYLFMLMMNAWTRTFYLLLSNGK